MIASSLPSLIQQQQRECVFLVGVWIPEYRGTGSGANRVSLGKAAGEYGSRRPTLGWRRRKNVHGA